MTIDDLKSHIEDIINVLSEESDKKINRNEIENEFKKFLEYGVPIEQAKQTILKKYGGSVKLQPSSSGERILISDVEPNQYNVNLLARVIAINPKDITVKGENRKIFYGILGDESGTIPFTAWKEVDVEKGDVIEVSNAYTKEWQGTPQLNFGDRVSIKKTEGDKLPEGSFEPREHNVIDLRPGIGKVEVTARIIDITERNTEINGEKRKIFSGIIGDETGKAQFTSWHDWKLKKGDTVSVSGGYIKSWKGIPQLTFDQNAKVKKLDKNKIPKTIESKMSKIPLHSLVEKRGALDVEIQGTIIEIRQGSGFINRCPECKRALINNQCMTHGNVKGVPDLRIKMIVDDGSGAINTTLNKELSEKLLGKTMEECKKIDESILKNEMNKKFFAKKICLQGNALGDEFGTNLIPKNAEIIKTNIEEEASKLFEEIEGLK